jgi:hypothetical protein
MTSKERPISAPIPGAIPDNPWIDDVGLLKDRKKHFEVNRLLTCHCQNCMSRVTETVISSYNAVFQGKEMKPELGKKVVTLYEKYIQLERSTKWEDKTF